MKYLSFLEIYIISYKYDNPLVRSSQAESNVEISLSDTNCSIEARGKSQKSQNTLKKLQKVKKKHLLPVLQDLYEGIWRYWNIN